MSISERAEAAKRLMNDEAFTLIMREVRERQIGVFVRPSSSTDDREAAHGIICGLEAINDHIRRLISDQEVAEKREG